MTFRTMEIFLAVVHNEGMQAASRALYISVSSVSEAIAELEREFGQKLFERLNRRLYITPAGEMLRDYATRMLNLHGELSRQLTATNEEERLRIGATVTVGSSILLPILRDANLLHAKVMVNNTRVMEERLLKNELDIALVEGVIHNEYLLAEPVMEDELVIACNRAHEFALSGRVAWEDLAASTLLMREEGSGTREKLIRFFEGKHLKPNIVWESSCIEALLQAVELGVGVTVISRRLVPERLAIARIDGFDGKRMFSLVRHKDKYVSQGLARFMWACRHVDAG